MGHERVGRKGTERTHLRCLFYFQSAFDEHLSYVQIMVVFAHHGLSNSGREASLLMATSRILASAGNRRSIQAPIRRAQREPIITASAEG